jgi:hypothetical protein
MSDYNLPVNDVEKLLRFSFDSFIPSPKRILVPFAGEGFVAQVAKRKFPEATIDCIENNPATFYLLKSFNLIEADFFHYQGEEKYDLVIMDPPFKKMLYIDAAIKGFDFTLEHGFLSTIIPEAMLNKNSEAVNTLCNLIAQSDFRAYIEAPFKKRLCLFTRIYKLSASEQKLRENEWEGFPSFYHYSLNLHHEAPPPVPR